MSVFRWNYPVLLPFFHVFRPMTPDQCNDFSVCSVVIPTIQKNFPYIAVSITTQFSTNQSTVINKWLSRFTPTVPPKHNVLVKCNVDHPWDSNGESVKVEYKCKRKGWKWSYQAFTLFRYIGHFRIGTFPQLCGSNRWRISFRTVLGAFVVFQIDQFQILVWLP